MLRTANYKEQGRYSPKHDTRATCLNHICFGTAAVSDVNPLYNGLFSNCFRKLRQTSSNCPGNLKRQDLPEAGYSCCCCSS